jgi:hypothetical protein
MTQAQIRKRRKELEGRLKEIRGDEKIVRAQLKALEGECDHPDLYEYSSCGELGQKCPDCGLQT